MCGPPAPRSRWRSKKFAAIVAEEAARHPGAIIETFATDEHRIGPQPVTRRVWAPRGQRPVAPCHHRFEWLYVTAFVSSANWLLEELDARGATAVIPPKANRKQQRHYDGDAYKWRHLIENYFSKIKKFRGIATRYDKTECSYAANWFLVAALIASR